MGVAARAGHPGRISLILLGRGPYFGRVLLLAWAVAMVSHPPHPALALQRVVGCEALPLVAGVYFAGLQVLLSYWAVLRLRDAGQSPLWAFSTWVGALPGLAAGMGYPMAGEAQALAYGLGILATLGIGALEPVARGGVRIAHEHWVGRYGRRLLLPVILLQVLVLAPRSDAAVARWLIEDGMHIAPVLQQAVETRWRAEGRLPDSNHAAGLPPPEGLTGNAVAYSGVGPDGRVYLVFEHPRLPCPVRGARIELVPEETGSDLLWRCVTALPEAVRPHACREPPAPLSSVGAASTPDASGLQPSAGAAVAGGMLPRRPGVCGTMGPA